MIAADRSYRMSLPSLCAWCGRALGTTAAADNRGPVSHGICADCANRVLLERGRQLGEFLDSLAAPVVVIDNNFRVLGANTQARGLTSARLPSGTSSLLGEVFLCVHAMSGGSCGKEVHCSGCVIRSTVDITMATGRGCERVPAKLRQVSSENDRDVQFFISTTKVNEFVFLNIDPLGKVG